MAYCCVQLNWFRRQWQNRGSCLPPPPPLPRPKHFASEIVIISEVSSELELQYVVYWRRTDASARISINVEQEMNQKHALEEEGLIRIEYGSNKEHALDDDH